MRHALAILMSVVISFPLLAPLLAWQSSVAAKLPACCRRDGKHGCGMKSQPAPAVDVSKSTAASIRSQPSRCPLYPGPSPVPSNDRTAIAGRTQDLAPLLWGGLAPAPQAHSRFHFTYASALHKRGPPAPLA